MNDPRTGYVDAIVCKGVKGEWALEVLCNQEPKGLRIPFPSTACMTEETDVRLFSGDLRGLSKSVLYLFNRILMQEDAKRQLPVNCRAG